MSLRDLMQEQTIESMKKCIAELKDEIQDMSDTEASLVKQLMKSEDRLIMIRRKFDEYFARDSRHTDVHEDLEAANDLIFSIADILIADILEISEGGGDE